MVAKVCRPRREIVRKRGVLWQPVPRRGLPLGQLQLAAGDGIVTQVSCRRPRRVERVAALKTPTVPSVGILVPTFSPSPKATPAIRATKKERTTATLREMPLPTRKEGLVSGSEDHQPTE